MKAKEEGSYYTGGLSVPETPKPGETPSPWEETQTIGKPMPRVDSYDRVSGSAIYPSDVILPDMLYGAILRCSHPHARVKNIDTSRAEKMSGVRVVITGHTPGADLDWTYGQNIQKKTKLFDPLCRYEGEEVVAVAAETPYQAWDSLESVQVEYEVLPFVGDERAALQSSAPAVHPGGNRVAEPVIYERGDVEKGFADADVVLEQTYRTESEIHTPMELHGCVAKWDGNSLTVWESTQGVYAVQSGIANVLKIPLSHIRVIGSYMGGGFGSKLQAGKYTIIAALLAKKAARPVKLFLTREETYLCVGNRPPANMKLKAGVKRDGTLTAFDFRYSGTGGAYPSGGISGVDFVVKDLYTCPNVRTEGVETYIHAGPARPFRAPGHPQGAWALEQMMDALAEAISMDPVELRLKNIPSQSQSREGTPPYTTTGLARCLQEGAQAFGWKEARQRVLEDKDSPDRRRGVGMAAGMWVAGGGRPPSTAIVKLFADGSANLNMGASDIGTGTKTIMAMIVAEELGISLQRIRIENADTGTTQYATPSGGSKTVPTESPAVRAAAIQVKQRLYDLAGKDLGIDPSQLTIKDGVIQSNADDSKRISIPEVTGLKSQGGIVGIGYRGPNLQNKVVNPFAAQFCEVEVNLRTGEIKILRFLAAQDSGRVMNPLTFANQVLGGIVMGIGLAMTEARVLDRGQTGKVVNKNWHDYKIPTALDVPMDMITHAIDLPDLLANTTGAKGLGEPCTIPTAAALANAVCNAIGIRVTETPMTPLSLSPLLAHGGKKK